MIHKLKKNFSSPDDIWLFLRIFSFITLLPAMVKCQSIPTLLKKLTPAGKNASGSQDIGPVTEKIVKYTDYILSQNWLIYKKNCLKRSLILYHFLRKHGIEAHICMGVKKENSSCEAESEVYLQGHAWLTYKGDIFLENNPLSEDDYKQTYCFP